MKEASDIWFHYFVFGILITGCNVLLKNIISSELTSKTVGGGILLMIVISGFTYNLGSSDREGMIIAWTGVSINAVYFLFTVLIEHDRLKKLKIKATHEELEKKTTLEELEKKLNMTRVQKTGAFLMPIVSARL